MVATALGIAFDRRARGAQAVARGTLGLMLYVLLPFVSFVNIAHVHLTFAGGAGLAVAYVAVGAAGVAAWFVARTRLRLPRAEVGAMIVCVVVVNTGYLGYPMTVALLGASHLPSAIAYDQIVSGPMTFLVGFAVGAAFGRGAGESGGARVRAFVTRNPPLIAVIAGLIAPPSLAPAALVTASHVIVAALLGLGFFVVGIYLSAERREDAAPLIELPDRRVATAVVLRLSVAPALLAAFSLVVVRLPHVYLLQAAMPTGISSLIVGHAYGLDQRVIATTIIWSTAAVLVVGLAIELL